VTLPCPPRPPFSIGVFAQHETRAVLQWFISSYYRHYKLYQYAFTDRCEWKKIGLA
jgi:hypothetical protein